MLLPQHCIFLIKCHYPCFISALSAEAYVDEGSNAAAIAGAVFTILIALTVLIAIIVICYAQKTKVFATL